MSLSKQNKVRRTKDCPTITTEMVDYPRKRWGKNNAFFPSHQSKWTESIPGTYYKQITSATLSTFFGNINEQNIDLRGGLFDGVIEHLALAMDFTVSGSSVTLVPTDFFIRKFILTQSQGNQTDLLTLFPHVKLLYTMSNIATDQVKGHLEMTNMGYPHREYLGTTAPLQPSTSVTYRLYYYMPEGPLNALRIFNQSMGDDESGNSLRFKFTTQPNIIASGSGTPTLVQLGWQIQTRRLGPLDRILISNKSKLPEGRYFADARDVPLADPITIATAGGGLAPINIKLDNIGGRMFGYGITFMLASATNTNNGYMSGCVHPGDNATIDVQKGTTTQINWGIPMPIVYLQKQIMNTHQLRNDLLIDNYYTMFVPLTNSLPSCWAGAARGFRYQTKNDNYNAVIQPTALIQEVQTIAKVGTVTAGIWQYVDPVTGDISAPVAFGASTGGGSAAWASGPTLQGAGAHDVALASLPRLKNLGIQVLFGNAFTDGTSSVTVTITSFLTNGLGGPIGIIFNGVIVASAQISLTATITTGGRRGFMAGMPLQTTIFGLYGREIIYQDKILYVKDMGPPEYEDAKKAAEVLIETAKSA